MSHHANTEARIYFFKWNLFKWKSEWHYLDLVFGAVCFSATGGSNILYNYEINGGLITRMEQS